MVTPCCCNRSSLAQVVSRRLRHCTVPWTAFAFFPSTVLGRRTFRLLMTVSRYNLCLVFAFSSSPDMFILGSNLVGHSSSIKQA